MSDSNGNILVKDAYAQGKMINSAAWNFPRNISLSDIDVALGCWRQPFALDNNGHILLMEFSTTFWKWESLHVGQSRLYENLVKAGNGKIHAVLCFIHKVPYTEEICSKSDVKYFTPLGSDTIENADGNWESFVGSVFKPGGVTKWINEWNILQE